MIEERNYSIQSALAEIEGLSLCQVRGINESLTRKDVIDLNERADIRVLAALKKHGLTADMLLKRVNKPLFEDHCFVIEKLIEKEGYSIDSALARIDSMSWDKIRQMRLDIMQRDNLFIHDNHDIEDIEKDEYYSSRRSFGY